jgi:hypothetical protein
MHSTNVLTIEETCDRKPILVLETESMQIKAQQHHLVQVVAELSTLPLADNHINELPIVDDDADDTTAPSFESSFHSAMDQLSVSPVKTTSNTVVLENGFEGCFSGLISPPALRPDHDDDSEGTETVLKNTRLAISPPRADPSESSASGKVVNGSKDHPVIHQKLSFGTISIREYPICLGDNPGGTGGAPLTIEWNHQSEASLDFELYEGSRPQRRTQAELSMPASVRFDILRAAGFSRQEIQQAVKQANIVRSRRRRTVEMMHMAPVQEFSEKIIKGTTKALSFRRKKDNEFHYSTTTLHKVEKKTERGGSGRPLFGGKSKSASRSFGLSTLKQPDRSRGSTVRTSSDSSLSLDESTTKLRNFSLARVD